MQKEQNLYDATDEDLRQLIFEHNYVIVKYLNEACEYCKLLAPPFEKFSRDGKYSKITFLRVDASENPVARAEVGGKDMPFFNIYKKGFLLDCGCIKTEEGVKELLNKLLAEID
ncbi:thioredoxin family protein [Pontibacter sp. 13R65]|uniref:thioredoxin family protein n=1 Tax=Pontibacter sp. 13R65 TaxID=3127458 RepID=UPI00301C0446